MHKRYNTCFVHLAVHIYLCDDSPKDYKERYNGQTFATVALRQQMIDALYQVHGIPVIRVTRVKGKGETNPKSANLNNCLKQIYGEAIPPESEVVAVFDADQAAHSHFFTSTLPWMDAGDDVALVQSPQVSKSCPLGIVLCTAHLIFAGCVLLSYYPRMLAYLCSAQLTAGTEAYIGQHMTCLFAACMSEHCMKRHVAAQTQCAGLMCSTTIQACVRMLNSNLRASVQQLLCMIHVRSLLPINAFMPYQQAEQALTLAVINAMTESL